MSRNDAAFFTQHDGCDLVWQTTDKMVRVYKNGEMRIKFGNDIIRYTSDLDERGFDTDEKLWEATNSGLLDWIDNPWFEVVWDDNEDGEIVDGFNEAVEYALKVRRGDL